MRVDLKWKPEDNLELYARKNNKKKREIIPTVAVFSLSSEAKGLGSVKKAGTYSFSWQLGQTSPVSLLKLWKLVHFEALKKSIFPSMRAYKSHI